VAHLRRARPHVVVTFDPYGAYGHPDHIAISQFTTAAVTAAAGAAEGEHFSEPHQVLKLYYLAETHANLRLYEEAFGELIMTIDDTERRATAWPDWAITTRINTTLYWRQVRQAVLCHRSQLPGYESLKNLPEDLHKELWGTQTFYRAMSLVNSGRQTEDDLFTGVRQPLQEHRII
jgi:LmbE family N-acetylglucosaminyl deacetylase